jgi:hypothetical protein
MRAVITVSSGRRERQWRVELHAPRDPQREARAG